MSVTGDWWPLDKTSKLRLTLTLTFNSIIGIVINIRIYNVVDDGTVIDTNIVIGTKFE